MSERMVIVIEYDAELGQDDDLREALTEVMRQLEQVISVPHAEKVMAYVAIREDATRVLDVFARTAPT